MVPKNETLRDILKSIRNSEVILPDFQRDFEWVEEDRQKKIAASVLARLPIGTILLLKGNTKEYSSRLIGTNLIQDLDEAGTPVKFLLDGQQRITVLANIFSDLNFEQTKDKISDLVSVSLKRRFFLKLINEDRQEDIFGVKVLNFPIKNPKEDMPQFLTADIAKHIVVKPFNRDDKNWYNPYNPGNRKEINDYCTTYSSGFLVPLFYLVDTKENSEKRQIIKEVIKNIANAAFLDLVYEFNKLTDDKEKIEYAKKILTPENRKCLEESGRIFRFDEFPGVLEIQKDDWQTSMLEFLDTCLNEINLKQIIVEEAERGRAIDIYENLNLGGVILDTFDLIIARVAKISKEHYYVRLKYIIESEKAYPINLVPEKIRASATKLINDKKYNASVSIGSINEKDGKISDIYKEAFLNTLALIVNDALVEQKFSMNKIITRENKLSMEPLQIHENTNLACESLDRAFFFFQVRCGITKISGINYKLMIPIVAAIFSDNEYYNSEEVHRILEAWYWGSVFSGKYDKDQNTVASDDLKKIINSVNRDPNKSDNIEWIKKIGEDVLDAKYFSDQKFLLYEDSEETRRPKEFLRESICQFFLSQGYYDMFDDSYEMNVFQKNPEDFEMHHVIPLGSTKDMTIKESTKELRKNKNNFLNSPLNFIYLSSQTNSNVGSMSLSDYQAKINKNSAVEKLCFSNLTSTQNDVERKKILEQRHKDIKNLLKARIKDILPKE